MCIYHGHSAADLDLPEGYPLNHGLGWSCCRRPTSLMYRLSGSGWMRDDGMPLGFFPAGMPYAVRSRRSREFVLTEFTPEFVAAVQGPDRRGAASLRFVTMNDPLVIQILRTLWNDVEEGTPTGQLYGQCLGTTLVAQLLKIQQTGAGVAGDYGKELSSVVLRRLIEYIEENLEDDLSLPDLAAIAGTGTNHLIHFFKRSTGMSPHQYVVAKRIERAKNLLHMRSLSLSEIALRAGFADHSHFSKTFHRLTGVSPRTYRASL
jgi:AraC family transcriptional regulator